MASDGVGNFIGATDILSVSSMHPILSALALAHQARLDAPDIPVGIRQREQPTRAEDIGFTPEGLEVYKGSQDRNPGFRREATAMRNRLIIPPVAMIVGLLMASLSLFAHHGNAEFDIGKRVTVKGTVVRWSWSNPHCFLSLDVKGDDGSAVHWVVETQPPRSISAGGFSQQTFKPGDEVTLTLEPVKNGRPLGRMLEVMLPNGKKLVTGHLD